MADRTNGTEPKTQNALQSRLSVKDFATMGIFCAIMFVVFMAYSILTGASLFYSMIFNAGDYFFLIGSRCFI